VAPYTTPHLFTLSRDRYTFSSKNQTAKPKSKDTTVISFSSLFFPPDKIQVKLKINKKIKK
jgi:hypothetical protein